MPPHYTLLVLPLVASLHACTAAQDKSPAPNSSQADSPAATNPMARSERMIGGEWRMTSLSGKPMYTTSHWGPGEHSVRSMTHGFEANGNPWRDMGVAYWHPGRKEICTLSLSPFAASVSDGVIRIDGESSEAYSDLYQTGGHRKLVSRSGFEGPDKLHSALLEETGPNTLTPLTEWDFIRSRTLTPIQPLTTQEAGTLPLHLRALEPLLGHTWNSIADATHALNLQSYIEWTPLANGIYARVTSRCVNGEPEHLLDAYIYHHTGAKVVRCLALSQNGGVYEGDLKVLDGGALQFDLKGYEGDQVVSRVVRVDLEKDGTLRTRMWGAGGAEGADAPILDARHTTTRDPYFTPIAAKTTPQMPSVIIRNIRQDRAGNIWFATFGGPIRYDGKVFTNFADEVGLARTRIFSLHEDRSGALWFGSITGGATRFDGQSFVKFTDKDGLGDNDVTWIFQDRDSNMWFGTGNGVTRYDGKTMTNFTTKDGLASNSVYAITQDLTGRIWFGTQGGVCSYDGKSFSNLADTVGRPFVNVRAMVVDHSGNLWFGGQEGAFRYDGKILTTFTSSFTSKDGLLDDFVGSMIVDRAGNIWFGHPGHFPGGGGGGATRYDGKSFKYFTKQDGLNSTNVYCMLEDRAGNIWFGSVDAGACRYDGKGFTNFSALGP